MVFPDKSLVKPNTDIGRMMDNMTKYSFDKPNVHDDACDSICMYRSYSAFINSKRNNVFMLFFLLYFCIYKTLYI